MSNRAAGSVPAAVRTSRTENTRSTSSVASSRRAAIPDQKSGTASLLSGYNIDVIGIETEYGIYVEGKGAQDLVAEATQLVKLCPSPVATGWDYSREHPRRDVRGFTVDHLSVDPHDAQFEQSGRPHSTDIEVR